MNLLTESLRDYKPQINDILKYARACGLEGEEQTLLCGIIAFHGANQCVMVTGPSQAGKTHLSKIAMSTVVPRADDVDRLVDNRETLLKEGGILSIEFGSTTSMAYNEEKLAEADGIYIPEYQKITEGGGSKLVMEVLKAFGEGRDAYRDVTDMKKKGTTQQVMKASNWWSNIATENPLKLDVETGNRVLPLYVDMSEEQTRRIMLFKAKREFIAGRQKTMLSDETIAFKEFMKRYRATRDTTFENPFATYIAEHYLPAKYIKSRRAIDFYLSFNRAIAKWHALNNERTITAKDSVLVDLEDIFQTEEIYGTKCRFDMLQLDPNSMEIFRIFERYQDGRGKDQKKVLKNEDGRVMLDCALIHKELANAGGINLKLNVVEQMLDELQECGYLEYSTGLKKSGTKYMLVDVEKPVNSVVEYGKLLEAASGLVKEWFPESYESWFQRNSKLSVRNPFTGDVVSLVEDLGKSGGTHVPDATGPVIERRPKELSDYIDSGYSIKWS